MRNVEFEVCYYAEANGYLAKCHCKCVTEVVTHKGSMTFEDFEKRLKINCLKKYLYFTENNDDITIDTELLKKLGEDKSEDIDLFTNIKFINRMPVPIIYKGRKLVGDKVELQIANNERAQDIAYMLLGTGLLENCARGCGFLNFKNYE